ILTLGSPYENFVPHSSYGSLRPVGAGMRLVCYLRRHRSPRLGQRILWRLRRAIYAFRHPPRGWPQSLQHHRPAHREFHLANLSWIQLRRFDRRSCIQHIESSISQIFAGYNFADRIGVQFNLPLIYREFKRPRGAVIDSGTEFGIGDVSLIGNYMVYRKLHENYTLTWNVLGGVKFPTGNSSHLKESDVESENGLPESGIGGHDLALGSGSFDGILGTGIYARWKHTFLTAGFQYAARSEGDFGHQYANDFTWAGGPGYYLALEHTYTLALQAIVSGESKGKDTVHGVPDEDSAETIVYLGPQINFTWSTRLSAQVGVDIPLSIDNSGLQAVPDYRVHAGLTWRF